MKENHIKWQFSELISAFLILLLSLIFSSCQKDLNLESEVVLVNKELIINYDIIERGIHTFWLFENQTDLLSGKNSLKSESKEINSNAGVVSFKFENIDVEEVFVKIRIVNNIGNGVKDFKYGKSIMFPEYNLLLIRGIGKTEWTPI